MTYFKNVNTIEELRKQYRTLIKKYHPDNRNGSEEITKAVNNEYEQLFKILNNRHESKATGTNNSNSCYGDMKYNFEDDEKLREVLQKIINFSDITIEICGSFIWVSGNTYQYKKEFKEFGFFWASQKKQWYWRPETYIKKSKKALSMEDIRSYYGSTEVKTESRLRIAQA